jgi:hypothetical protein
MATHALIRTIEDSSDLNASRHARGRMRSRQIPEDVATLALEHGRYRYVRGSLCFAVGRREVADAARQGIDIRAAEGIRLVLSTDGWTVITAYRNHDLRDLRRRRRGCCPWRPRRDARAEARIETACFDLLPAELGFEPAEAA